MITDEILVENGYNIYPTPSFAPQGVEKFFQKPIRDAEGKRKYFIDIYKYSPWTHPYTGEQIGPNYEFEVYLTDKENGCPTKMLLYAGWELKEVEERIEKLFNIGLFAKYDDEHGE